jgi:hypothetical protein
LRVHPIVRLACALIAFRLAGLFFRYIVQPDAPFDRRLALFVPAAISNAGVLAAIAAALLLLCGLVPPLRRAIVVGSFGLFAVLMLAGQADVIVSSITGAPLTPTVFRTFRGLSVVRSNEFLEPLRANWRWTSLGIVVFSGVVAWMIAVLVNDARHATRTPRRRVSAAGVATAIGVAWLAGFAKWPPPSPIETAFAREYLGLDATQLRVPEADAIRHLRSLVGLPPGAAWIGDRYPLAYVPPPRGDRRSPAASPPDIVVVMVESLRAEDLGFITGRHDSVTPRLDSLAARSVVFTSYLSNAFPSAPSVIAFHCSAWPHRRKEIVTDFSDRHFDSMPERLRDSGYDTIYIGADPHFDNQDRWLTRWYAGVSDLVASGSPATDRTIVARAIDEIREHDRAHPSKPLFAFVSTYSTHYPFRVPSDAGEREASDEDGLTARYRQVLRYADRELGTLLDMLADRRRRDRTVTVVVGDHSFYTNLRKTSGLPENDNEWTAALVSGPADLVGPPRRVEEPASHVDMLPTVLGLVGDERPTAALGSDLFAAPRTPQRSVLAIRPGGVRFDRDGYAVMVDARVPNGEEIRRSFGSPAGEPPGDLPSAEQMNEWVEAWSYLIEQDRVWNRELLKRHR